MYTCIEEARLSALVTVLAVGDAAASLVGWLIRGDPVPCCGLGGRCFLFFSTASSTSFGVNVQLCGATNWVSADNENKRYVYVLV